MKLKIENPAELLQNVSKKPLPVNLNVPKVIRAIFLRKNAPARKRNLRKATLVHKI